MIFKHNGQNVIYCCKTDVYLYQAQIAIYNVYCYLLDVSMSFCYDKRARDPDRMVVIFINTYLYMSASCVFHH